MKFKRFVVALLAVGLLSLTVAGTVLHPSPVGSTLVADDPKPSTGGG
jgi:hypothetical protein